ncbi:sulfotransferase family protein [Pseudoxanthomonas gei]|uniref:Sulfotransferase family protein n=1 Tax=Pseudoxanthomonas gei TaxID=1383030 RepID=A0ABX0AHA4_9GAMM|nr:tetratricopeptide repeat-containing sulfotransferase family protein [Pseudoxanthomonas gei]NDK39850.1 sulfotransferase family protein [Pseudoxanthomonas gei]
MSPVNAATVPTASLDTALAHASRLLATDPALAGEQAAEIIKAVGPHPMALLILGASHRARGDLEGALAILQPLADAQTNSALTHLELGIALGKAGQGDRALAALRRAVALKPDLPQAWRSLGDHLMALDDPEGADAAYANHLRYSTRDPNLLAAANALHEQRIAEAEALLREHLTRAPTDVAAIRMLAEVAMRLGRNEDAENLLARSLQLAPGFHAARQNYALVLHRSNKPAEALQQIDQLLLHEADNPGYLNLKAVVLCRVGDYEPAIALYSRILQVYPQHPRIWMSYGHALKTAGHQDRAIAAYRRSLQLEPGAGEVWWSLANLKTFRFSAADLAVMQRELERPGIASENRQHLEFAIGKALEDEGRYEDSFRHYRSGNDLRRATLSYSANDTSARVARIKRSYTREFFASRSGSGAQAGDPVFIVGLPRAGSTLLEQILSSHSAVEGTMELPEITSITRELRGRGEAGNAMPYHDVLESMGADALRALGERYLQHTRIQRKTDAPFFIDKMPNNFLHIGLIQLMLPNARIIDARRHPLACCFSGYKQHFARGQSFTYGLDDIGRYYADYVELMAHFDEVLPGRVHRVIYEQMVDDTETQVRLLLDHCGLPFEESCLRFFENTRAVRTASSEQVRRPIYREGVDHWRNFDPWLDPLKEALGPVLDTYPAVPEFPLAKAAS